MKLYIFVSDMRVNYIIVSLVFKMRIALPKGNHSQYSIVLLSLGVLS